jgi:hypothetical protein
MSGARVPFAALRESAVDAVDGSSTGTQVPWMWVLLRPVCTENLIRIDYVTESPKRQRR